MNAVQRVYRKVQTTAYTHEQEDEISQKTSKWVSTVPKKKLWVKLSSTGTRMIGREKYGREKQLMIWSIPHHLSNNDDGGDNIMALTNVSRWLLIMWPLIEGAGWIVMCAGLHCLLRFTHMLQNWLNSALRCKSLILKAKCKSNPNVFQCK